MKFTELGRTRLQVSRIGFGCAAIGGYDYGAVDDAQSVLAIRAALDGGVNFFDTAAVYGFGHSEEVLSRALANDRHDAVIATKGGVDWDESGRIRRTLDPTTVRAGVEASLRRLRIDSIPLFQLHWPDPAVSSESLADCLQGLIDEGKIRSIGVCNHTVEETVNLQRYVPVQSIQVAYSLTERQHGESLKTLKSRLGVTSIAYNVLARGFFGGAYASPAEFSGTDTRQHSHLFQSENLNRNLQALASLRKAASQAGASPSRMAISWVLNSGVIDCAIVGAKTADQVKDNLGAVDTVMPRNISALP
jgi:aryl-alcohol dehydrogenase-like predicted oxidoreductase